MDAKNVCVGDRYVFHHCVNPDSKSNGTSMLVVGRETDFGSLTNMFNVVNESGVEGLVFAEELTPAEL